MPAKKQVTKEMILEAAFAVLRQEGSGAVTVKTLAERLNCSTQPVYLSFRGMDELRTELMKKAADYFFHYMKFDRGEGNLYEFSYIRFALEEKELFQYLFMQKNAFHEIRPALQPVIERAIHRFMEKYRLSYDEAHHFHDQLWMHAHGIASMAATEFCQWNLEKVKRMLEECEYYLSRKYEV